MDGNCKWIRVWLLVLGAFMSLSVNAEQCGCPGSNEAQLPCLAEKVRLKLNSVCPKQGECKDRTWFRQAKHPIVSVEAHVLNSPPDKNPRSNFPAYLSQMGPFTFLQTQNTLANVRLLNFSIFREAPWGPSFEKEVLVDYSPLKNITPYPIQNNGWNKVWISFYVCDDTNQDGKCSDESIRDQISNMAATHQLCRLPSAIALDVWHCD